MSYIPNLFDSVSVGSKLRIINFSGNNLNEIPSSIFELTELESVNFNDNNISEIPDIDDDFCDLVVSNVAELSLAQNFLCNKDNVDEYI